MKCGKVRKTQEGGLNCGFFFFSHKTEVTVQKQIEFSFESEVQNLNAADKYREREREKKETKQLYRFLPQTGSSLVPLHFQGEFTKINI